MKRLSLGILTLVIAATFIYILKDDRPPNAAPISKKANASEKRLPRPHRHTPDFDFAALVRENRELKEALAQYTSTVGDAPPAKVNRLRDILSRLPDQAIPELKLAKEDDWYAAVDGPLESVDDYRIALSKLRHRAEKRFAALVQPALRAYVDQKGGFPQSTSELKALVTESQVDGEMLARYKVAPANEVSNVRMGGDWIITQAQRIDSDFDPYIVIGPQGFGTFSRSPPERATVEPVLSAFRKANPGVAPNDPAQLLPYAATPEQRAEVERLIRSMARR